MLINRMVRDRLCTEIRRTESAPEYRLGYIEGCLDYYNKFEEYMKKTVVTNVKEETNIARNKDS